jgi:small-conductance mechanosensitive channel
MARQANWGLWWRFLILFIAALGLSWFARKAVLQKFGRDPADQEPSYARALVAAIADAVVSGVIPALIIAGLMAFFARPGALVSGPPERMLEVFLGVLLLLILIVAITRAVLAPELPQWRTIEVAPEKAHQITRIVVAIGVVYSVDIFFRLTSDDFPVSRELTTVGLTLMVLLQAGGMFGFSRPRL